MSKLNDLIAELCPHGVELRNFSEVCSLNARIGWHRLTKQEHQTTGDFLLITGTDFTSSYTLDYSRCAYVSEERYLQDPKIQLKNEDILITKDGTLGKVAQVKNLPKPATLNSGVFVVRSLDGSLNHRYILHYLVSKHFSSVVNQRKTGSTISHLTQELFSNLKIPVPPLEVQREIVRILDTFTELTAELTAELVARKQQYEYYRDLLLTFDKTPTQFSQTADSRQQTADSRQQTADSRQQTADSRQQTADSRQQHIVPRIKLGEIATEIFRGSGITREQVTATGIPCVRYGEIYTTYGVYFDKCVSHTSIEKIANPKYFEHGDILFVITGEKVEDIAKSTAYVGNEKCLAGGDIVVLRHNQNPKYLSYALATTDAVRQKTRGKIKSKVVHSSVPAIKEIEIPLPSLEEQERIVKILDRFDRLCNDLSEGLPAEIEARKQQYEFYRDKLLSFDKDWR